MQENAALKEFAIVLTVRKQDVLPHTVVDEIVFFRRSLNFPWQAPEVLTKDGAYTIQEERDVRNAMQLCSESFDL